MVLNELVKGGEECRLGGGEAKKSAIVVSGVKAVRAAAWCVREPCLREGEGRRSRFPLSTQAGEATISHLQHYTSCSRVLQQGGNGGAMQPNIYTVKIMSLEAHGKKKESYVLYTIILQWFHMILLYMLMLFVCPKLFFH